MSIKTLIRELYLNVNRYVFRTRGSIGHDNEDGFFYKIKLSSVNVCFNLKVVFFLEMELNVYTVGQIGTRSICA